MRLSSFVILSICISLCGCDELDDEFVEDCESKRGFTEAQCICVAELIDGDDHLEDKGRNYIKAMLLGDQSEASRIQSGFSLFEGTTIIARAAWISSNSQQACGVQM